MWQLNCSILSLSFRHMYSNFKKIVVFFFHQTVEEHQAYIWFLSSSRIICAWASMLIPHWLITTIIIIIIIIIISYLLLFLCIITTSFSPRPYWNNIPNLLKVPRVAWNKHHEHGHQTSRGDCYAEQNNVGWSGSRSRFKFKELGLRV